MASATPRARTRARWRIASNVSLGAPPYPFVGVYAAVVVAVDAGPGIGRPIFVGAQEAVAVGVERGPVIGPIIRVVISLAIEAAGAVAILEFATADAAVLVHVPKAVGAGAPGIPFVAADEAVVVDVDVAVSAANV